MFRVTWQRLEVQVLYNGLNSDTQNGLWRIIYIQSCWDKYKSHPLVSGLLMGCLHLIISKCCVFLKLSFIRGIAMEGSEFVFLGGKDGPLAPGINPATSTAPTGPLFLSRAMGPACVTHLLCTRSWDVTALHTEWRCYSHRGGNWGWEGQHATGGKDWAHLFLVLCNYLKISWDSQFLKHSLGWFTRSHGVEIEGEHMIPQEQTWQVSAGDTQSRVTKVVRGVGWRADLGGARAWRPTAPSPREPSLFLFK